MAQTMYLLFESASGYGLFERLENDEIGQDEEALQAAQAELQRFGKIVKMVSFLPFKSAQDALDNAHHISEGILSDGLRDWLEAQLPKSKKKGKFELGVGEANLGSAIQEATKIPCVSNATVKSLLRGVRLHFEKFIKELKDGDLHKAQLGLAHSYSRAKVKFNVHRVDNMIIQSISLLDQMDKDMNTFVMRVKEWYSWHFPELTKIVNDNLMFVRLVLVMKDRSQLKEEALEEMAEVVNDRALAENIFKAAKTSMGQDISAVDLLNITHFAERVVKLDAYRSQLHSYLKGKMHACAPNLSALIGEHVGARLISHAGSLTNLAKYPASTVQILGAEKALFRALKTRGNTPKYGLIFHSTFIGRASQKNKGRISRYLANKCSIASRIDAFSETPTQIFGDKLREQVEERLEFYNSGTQPRKNADVMKEAIGELGSADDGAKKKKKKRKAEDEADEEPPTKKAKKSAEEFEAVAEPEDGAEKKKKKKKSKKAVAEVDEE